MKSELLENTSIILLRKGFTVKNLNSCFDILARKEDKIILIKVNYDANSLSNESIKEINKIASCIEAVPLIIAEKSGSPLDDNVVYSRFGVFTVNLTTFENALNQELPFVKSSKAGLTTSLNGQKLRKLRENKGLSLNDLSKKLGVSRRMVYSYENENSDIVLNKAWKLYDLFGHEVFNQIDIFSQMNEIIYECISDVGKKYYDLGFKTIETKKSVFDIIAKKEKEIILTNVGDVFNKELNIFSKLLDAEGLIVFEHKKPNTELPKIAKEEFLELENEKELIKIIKEFQ